MLLRSTQKAAKGEAISKRLSLVSDDRPTRFTTRIIYEAREEHLTKEAAVAKKQLPACNFHPKDTTTVHTTHSLQTARMDRGDCNRRNRFEFSPKQPRRCALMTRTTIMESRFLLPRQRWTQWTPSCQASFSPHSVETDSLVGNFVRTGTHDFIATVTCESELIDGHSNDQKISIETSGYTSTLSIGSNFYSESSLF